MAVPFSLRWLVRVQDFFEIFDLEAIRRLALRLPHPSDGIIFTPVKLPYVTGTCPLLLKWKPPHLNTVSDQRRNWKGSQGYWNKSK